MLGDPAGVVAEIFGQGEQVQGDPVGAGGVSASLRAADQPRAAHPIRPRRRATNQRTDRLMASKMPRRLVALSFAAIATVYSAGYYTTQAADSRLALSEAGPVAALTVPATATPVPA